MKFKQLTKELNETNTFTSSLASTKKTNMSSKMLDTILGELKDSKIDPNFKNGLIDLIEKGQVEKALKMAIDFVVSSKNTRMSAVKSIKNKRFNTEE